MLTEEKCESCSSKDFTRQGDFLVCDYCGSRYYAPEKKQPQYREHSAEKIKPPKKMPLSRRIAIIVVCLLAVTIVAASLPDLLDDMFTTPMQSQRINVGETGVANDWSAVVGAPTEVCTVKGSYRENFYVKAPITITATNDCTIKADDFQMDDSKYPDDALPKELTLKKGETFSGSLYINWYSASDHRDNEEGLRLGSFRKAARFIDYNNERLTITWEFDITSADAIDVDAETIMSTMPDTTVRVHATYQEAFLDSSNPEAVFTMDGSNGLPVVVAVTPSFKTKLASLNPGDSVILRGDLNTLQARMPDTSLIREVVLTIPSIVE